MFAANNNNHSNDDDDDNDDDEDSYNETLNIETDKHDNEVEDDTVLKLMKKRKTIAKVNKATTKSKRSRVHS